MSEPVANEHSEHKIGKNVSKWRLKDRFEHKIDENVSKSVANGRFEHKIGKSVSGFGYGCMI